MAEWHLKEIETRLGQIGWNVISKTPGNNYDISGTWVLKRAKILYLDFPGLDDMDTLPIERSYGCHLRDTAIELYFFKKGKKWKNSLNSFLKELNKIN